MTKTISSTPRIIIAGVVAALTVGSAGAASAQTGGGLGSIVNCDAPGGRQAVGAVMGALVGTALGNNIARGDDRGTGRIAGAAAGAAAGSYIGCKQQRDRVAGQGQGAYAPAPAAYNRPFDQSAAGNYVASTTVNIRSAPTTSAYRVGGLRAGQTFQALGRDGSWVVVDTGNGVGYVAGAYVRPVSGYRTAGY